MQKVASLLSSAPPLKTSAGPRYAYSAPAAATKGAKKAKKLAKSKHASTDLALAAPTSFTAPASFGPRVVGVVQQNGAAAVMVEQNGQVVTAKTGESVGGRQVGAITRCSVELGGASISVCNDAGQTPLTNPLQTAASGKANSPLLQGSTQGSQVPTGNDPFMSAPRVPQTNGIDPVIPAPLGSTPLTPAAQANRS